MTVSCSDCRSVFRVDPAKVPATGVRARCAVCGGVIVISGGTLPIAVTPASSNAALSSFASNNRVVSGMTPPSSRSVSATPPAPSRPFAPASSTPSIPTVAAVPVATTLMTPPTPASVSHRAPSPANALPAMTALVNSTEPSQALSPPTIPTVAGPSSVGASAAALAPGVPRKSINPFLNADPGQRARRLARALVSDLVAYHPQKQQDGLRDGTLRQLFREEIKKSYEEFVEQVGRELAESSPHFQDALNEILGGGRKLF